jgi:hypothetical protein
VPPALAGRLTGEGITSFEQWRKLSRRQRRSIFGITARMVAELDALARGAP